MSKCVIKIISQVVKFHTGNILGKLGVKNRTQAVAKARELGILKADPDFHSKTN
jgi:ATP/maltotriose-dependent transcriptional regulator MalT